MGVAINILSAVLKSVVNNKIGNELANELIGISIDGFSEKSVNMISDHIDKEKAKINYILSPKNMESLHISEENVDYVVAEIKDLLSKVKINDEIFRHCKYNSMDLSTYLLDEYRAYKSGNIECERDVKKALLAVADALIKLLSESEQFEKDFLIQISNSVDDTNAEIQKISEYMQENFNKLDVNNQEILGILHNIFKQIQSSNTQNKKQKVKSRTQEYADKWDENMFLNNFEEWDENAGVNVKLSDVYIEEHLPHFIWGQNKTESNNLDKLINKYIRGESNESKMLLILGQPGIGKSTLITWITAKFHENVEDILVYQVASDLKNVDWQSSDIYNEILNVLNLSNRDLNGKVIILDGFDEVSVGDNRKEILDNLYWAFTFRLLIKRLILIITCRENYIQDIEKVKCQYITLLPWDEAQIKSFSTLFQEKRNVIIPAHTIAKVIKSKEILGIPLILYMVLALDIAVEKDGSIVDIYDKIFSLDGGIYDRCIENKNFADIHRIGEIKKQIHQISREIAIWMFENNPDEACIPQGEYEKICNNIIQEQVQRREEIKQDFLIGNYFKLIKHCEGVDTEKLYFVHRSIYEYFVAETIYNSIETDMVELSNSPESKLAENIIFYLKKGRIEKTIAVYLQHMIIKKYNQMKNDKKEKFYQWWENMVVKTMDKGMFYNHFYNINEKRDIKELICMEVQCFLNLTEILRLILKTSNSQFIMQNANISQMETYIRYCSLIVDLNIGSFASFDLSVMWLSKVNLSGINLKNVNLRRANLVGSNLERANLLGADLEGAYLKDATLVGTNLKSAELRGAFLDSSIWNEAEINKVLPQLKDAHFSCVKIRCEGRDKFIFRSKPELLML